MRDQDAPAMAPVAGPRILLVRHGATALNQPKGTSRDVVRGQSNPPLTDEGRREAESLARRLAGAGIRELYASPLNRALHTAVEIGKPYHLAPRPARELLPWDMGALTGVQATVAKPGLRQYAERHPELRIPKGESFHQWERRFLPWLQKLMQHVERKNVTACCVTHSRCIKLLEGWLAAGAKGAAVNFDVMFRDDTEPGSIFDFRPAKNGKWEGQRVGRGFVQGA